MEESKSAEVSFKYYLPEHQDELNLHINAWKMYSLLHEIDQHCRSIIKYKEDATEAEVNLCEKIREMIYNEIDMDMVR